MVVVVVGRKGERVVRFPRKTLDNLYLTEGYKRALHSKKTDETETFPICVSICACVVSRVHDSVVLESKKKRISRTISLAQI